MISSGQSADALFGRRTGQLIIALLVQFASSCAYSADEPLRRLYESEFRLTGSSDFRPFVFSPDGKLIAGANWDEVRLWSFPEGKLQHDFSGKVQSNCIGFSADGKELLALGRRKMEICRFDVATGELHGKTKLTDIEEEPGATTFTISNDVKWLCMSEVYGNYAVWDTTAGKRQFHKKLQLNHPRSLVHGNALILWDGLFIDRYDVQTGDQLSHKTVYGHLTELIGNPTGTLLAGYSADQKAIVFFDPERDEFIGGSIPAQEREWRGGEAAISADGRRFVYRVDDGRSVFDRRVAVFDVGTGKVIAEFEPPGVYFVEQPVISPDGRYVFLAGSRSVFCPIEVSTGKPVREVPDHILAVDMLSFTPDAKTLLVGSRDKCQAWNVATGKPGVIFEKWYHTPYVAAVDNERALVSGLRGGGVRLQEIDTGAIVREFETGADKYLSAFQLATDRKTFVGTIPERRGIVVRRWDIGTGEVVEEKIIPPRGSNSDRGGPDPRYVIQGLALGGSRLVRLEEGRPPKLLADGSMDWGQADLLLEDWTALSITNRLTLPAPWLSRFADTANGSALAAVTSEPDYLDRNRKRQYGSTYLVIWDIASGRELLRVKEGMRDYFSKFALVAVTRELRLAATSRQHDHVDVWDAFTGKRLKSFDTGKEITALSLSDDGALLATGHADGRVYIWNTRDASEHVQPR